MSDFGVYSTPGGRKQKALEAFVVAMARYWIEGGISGDLHSTSKRTARDLLAAIEAEKKPEPESIVERLITHLINIEGCEHCEAIRDLERLAERVRVLSEECDAEIELRGMAHEIDGK